MTPGLWWQKFYPVEGDSAVAELWCGDQLWATLHLEALQLDALGEARIRTARQVLTVLPPRGPSEFAMDGAWRIDAAAAFEQLREARDWLLVNEQARVPG